MKLVLFRVLVKIIVLILILALYIAMKQKVKIFYIIHVCLMNTLKQKQKEWK